ncbi:baseplate J/gp47 family protein [Candidatus Agathobaculum pullicola]|uniref:baseplate J/gp47 family protein n=1 Tax=Candidatus Agathobaculum pullicola TaxID=2838426 RepID=UPI003F937A62
MADNAETLQTQLDALKATLLAQDFDSLTPESIQDMLRAFIEDELGLYTGEGSLLQIILAPGAYVFWEGLQALRAQVPISFVDETSGRFLDKNAAGYGITRKPGTAASVLLTFIGSAGTTIPVGTLCVTQDGLGFATDEALTLDEDGRGTVTATADAVGTAYNVSAGAIISMQQAVSGVTALTNEEAAVGGTDPEMDAALFARLDAYKKTPPTSGNEQHYHQWALEVNGVGAAAVIRCWDGPGTVKVIIADMALRPVEEELRAEVAAYIETQRPVTAEVTVESAAGVPVTVSVTVTTDGTVSKLNTEKELTERLVEYLGSIAFTEGAEVVYNRVLALVMGLPGVTDCAELLVGGGTDNVPLDANEIPMLGTVTVNGIAEEAADDGA